ncbi:MAG: hypothetical protein CEE41_02465 [Hadesarchaea archaeon B3_Hades]|nr:MAG: hypothetical protein CEE41_02465 [Hadesarchaea archaeon B3_Hades]
MKKEFGQGATEYLLIFAAVLIIVGAAVYYVSRSSGFPSISATFDVSDNEIRIKVDVGSIPEGEWAYSVSTAKGSPYTWTTGNEVLDSPYVSLGTYLAGTYYVSLKHSDSDHIYFYDQAVAIT